MPESDTPHTSPEGAPRWTDAVLLTGIGGAMLAWTWRGWADPLVDFGRELYVPWRLAAGERLFTDIAWFSGPLSQHWNALLFRVFGPGLTVIVASNVLVLAGTVAAIHVLTARAWGRLAASAACAVALLVFAFGQYLGIANYNWITPYAHELTHGIALALAGFVAMERGTSGRRTGAPIAAGLAVGLTFLTKAEVFAACLAGMLVFLPAVARADRARVTLIVLASAAAPVAVSWILLGGAATIGAWPPVLAGDVAALPFYRVGLGIDRPWLRVGQMLAWSGLWASAAAVLVAAARLSRRSEGLVAPLGVAALLLAIGALASDTVSWPDVLRPLPLATLAVIAATVAGGSRRGPSPPPGVLALAVFGLVLLGKVLLNVRVAHYGFALALPATAVVVAAAVGPVANAVGRFGARPDVFRAGMLALLAVFALEHVSVTGRWHTTKTEWVGTGPDAMRTDGRGAVVRVAIERIRTLEPTTLAVLPEGVMINYLARVPAPTPYVNFMPPEELLFGAEAWAEAFEASPPDLILSVPKDVAEYGRGAFGVGYGLPLTEWLAPRYRLEEVLRVEGIPFEIGVLRPAPRGNGP